MKIRRMMLVTFVLLAILTMGAVSASGDTNDTLAADDEMELSQGSAVEMVSADDGNDDVLSDEFLELQQSDELGSAPEDAMGATPAKVRDLSVDVSNTTINATLILTDLRTGDVFKENFAVGPILSDYLNATTSNVNGNITEAINQLLSRIQTPDGDNSVTVISQNVSDASVIRSMDNRTFDTVEDAEFGRYLLVAGEYANVWQINVTVIAEYRSSTKSKVIDNSADASSTSINATLILTDVRTGKVIMENITVGPVKANYTSGNNTELENNITDTISQLLSIAQSYAGKYAVTTKSVNVSTAEVVSRFDNRTYTWRSEPLPNTRYCLVGGSYGTLRQVNVTVIAEYRSSTQALVKDTSVDVSNTTINATLILTDVRTDKVSERNITVGPISSSYENATTSNVSDNITEAINQLLSMAQAIAGSKTVTVISQNVSDAVIISYRDNRVFSLVDDESGDGRYLLITGEYANAWQINVTVIAQYRSSSQASIVDNAADVSSTAINATLILTDVRTGKVIMENITVGPISSLYNNATNSNVSGNITEAINQLLSMAQDIAGGKTVTVIGQNVSDAFRLGGMDNRSFHYEGDETGGYLVVDGAYASFWQVNVTVTAEFESVLEYCTIAFDSNKGVGEMANETLEVGIVYTLPECAFTKDGRTFFGWNVEDYIIRKPGDNVTIKGNATFGAIWLCDDAENRVIFLDNLVDASSTNVVGILMLVDNSTGKLYNQTFVSQAIPALYSNSTASADLFADTVDKMYGALIDAALGIAGKSPVTFTGQNLSSAMIVNQWDHRIYRTINIESPDSEGMAIFDENGDINGTVIHHAGGDYGRLWSYNLTLSAEFESSPVINITNAAVILSSQSFTYNGKVQIPTVVSVGGKILKEGSDYTLSLSPASSKNAATYVMTITGTGSYAGVTTAKYTINKAANPLAVKGKTVKVKFSKLKKKAVKLAITKLVKFTKKGQGTMTYAKKSGSKKISINKKTGKVTIKKGLKKGTYKVKAKIKANGNANYKASAYKVVTFKIKVY